MEENVCLMDDTQPLKGKKKNYRNTKKGENKGMIV